MSVYFDRRGPIMFFRIKLFLFLLFVFVYLLTAWHEEAWLAVTGGLDLQRM